MSKVNRKRSFSFPMVEKRLKFLKMAAAAMMKEGSEQHHREPVWSLHICHDCGTGCHI